MERNAGEVKLMGKHSKKHNRAQQNNNSTNNFDMSQMGNLLNMDPSQLSGLLNNIDLNQLSSMFQGMGGGGSGGSSTNSAGQGGQQIGQDKRMELLNAIKPLVNAERSQLLDSIIQIYNISRIMKK
jgi:hypothetical protein